MSRVIVKPPEATVSLKRTQSHRTQGRPAEQVQPRISITCKVHGGEEEGRSSWELKTWDQALEQWGTWHRHCCNAPAA